MAPYVSRSEPEHSFLRIEVDGGGADVYLNDDDMMVNHAGGTATWDLLVRAASRANWTLLPNELRCQSLARLRGSPASLVSNHADSGSQ